MLHIMLAYLMLFADIFSVVCLYDAYLFNAIAFFKCFFHALSLGY